MKMIEVKHYTDTEIWNNRIALMGKQTISLSYEWVKIKEKVLGIHFVPLVLYYKNQPVGLLNIEMERLKINKIPFFPALKITVGGMGGEGFFLSKEAECADVINQMLYLIENVIQTKIIDKISIKDFFVYLDSQHHKKFSDLLNAKGYTENGKLFTVLLNLEEREEKLWRKLDKKCRNEIRQGYKRGVKVIQVNDLLGVEELFKIKTKYAYWGNSLLHKWEIFKNIHQQAIANGLMRIFLAKTKEDVVIAGASVITYRDLAIYYIAGMDRKYGWFRPLNVLIWEIIKWALNKGFKIFDLYGINMDTQNKPKDNRSKFKLGFGGDIYTIYEMRKRKPPFTTKFTRKIL